MTSWPTRFRAATLLTTSLVATLLSVTVLATARADEDAPRDSDDAVDVTSAGPAQPVAPGDEKQSPLAQPDGVDAPPNDRFRVLAFEPPAPTDFPADGAMPGTYPQPVSITNNRLTPAAPCQCPNCQAGRCCDSSCGAKPKTPPQPWKGLFFNNDFSYKRKPCAPYFCGEELKEMPLDCLGEESWISFGGELRFRHMNEDQRLRPGGPARTTYDLWRWRNYIDARFSESLRVYVEMLDASIFNQDLGPTPIDLNRWNIQNAFVDLRLAELDSRSVVARIGRQELLYGSQRLVSPLDWANTRRNFEGFKLFSHGETWDIDAWATQPVNTATGNGPLSRYDNERDEGDTSRYFSGFFAVLHGIENNVVDLYWLWDRETDFRATGTDYSRHTTGVRWLHNRPVKNQCCEVTRVWHTELEGGYQFGHDNGETVRAGFFTAGLGHTWKKVAWTPSCWLFYDWASGDRDPTDNENNTFYQLFPLGHKYLGLIDNVARQNISDINLRLVTKPTKKLTLTGGMHWMDLENENDFVYNIVGAPLGTPGVGDKIGEECDIVANYQFNPNFGVQLGYFYFWYGSAVNNSALQRPDASQVYVQSTLRY